MQSLNFQKEKQVKNRTLINNLWIPNDQIEFWEQYYGGKVVRDPRLNAMLEYACLTFMRKTGKIPEEIKQRDRPFVRYFPIQIEAEIFGTGLEGLETNKHIFIGVKIRF